MHSPGDACPCCGGTKLTRLGEDVTEVLERVPAKLKVIRHIRPRLSCRACETIIRAPAPDLPAEKGRPGPALIAHVVVSKYLARYTTDGRIGIDNNPAERSLRGIAVTRKNFLFLGSDRGGERAAVIYTALETARLNGVDPEGWLADVLARLAAGHSQRDLDQLMLWNWRREPARLAA